MIKKKICAENVYEGYLYHGSRVSNHMKITKQHFLMPGKDVLIQLDNGYYGKGIYATENLFYASVYGNSYKILKTNEKTSIICCRVIYDKTKVKEVKDLSLYGKIIDSDITNKYGIHHAYVGSKKNFTPINKSDIENNAIVASEFVFPNKFQIIPMYSLTVMRTDHLILWKDEHIKNVENSNYMEELSKKIEVNVYYKQSVDEAINLLKLKKYNKIKLITNGGVNLTGKTMIEESRKIIKSNFVCLVFASDNRHFEWVSKMENVLFTTSPSFFKEFAELKMIKSDIINFIHKLEQNTNRKFKIDENELLNFPLFDDNISIGSK